jgi:hypothetical protein
MTGLKHLAKDAAVAVALSGAAPVWRRRAGDREANRLPVTKAPFTLLMRLYPPKAEFLAGSGSPPPPRRVDEGQNPINLQRLKECPSSTFSLGSFFSSSS